LSVLMSTKTPSISPLPSLVVMARYGTTVAFKKRGLRLTFTNVLSDSALRSGADLNPFLA
jgi:hypothetical protein